MAILLMLHHQEALRREDIQNFRSTVRNSSDTQEMVNTSGTIAVVIIAVLGSDVIEAIIKEPFMEEALYKYKTINHIDI